MRRIGRVGTLLLAAVVASGALAVEEPVGGYAGLSGALMLPQGGSKLHRVGGATLRGGAYLSDWLAVEGALAWQEDLAGIEARGLWHWQGSELYSYYFGYSQLDPFFTFGACGWLGEAKGQVGPQLGFGTFYHLTDCWSLRFDADVTLGLESRRELLYRFSAGVQYEF